MRPEFPRLSRFLLPTEGLCTHTNCSHTAAARRAQGRLENSWKRSCEWKLASSGPNPQLWVIPNFKTTPSGGFSQLQTVCNSFPRDILFVSTGTGNVLVPAEQESSARRPLAAGGIQVLCWVSEIHILSLQNSPRCICGPCICGMSSAPAVLRAGAACAGGGGAQASAGARPIKCPVGSWHPWHSPDTFPGRALD